MLHIFTTAANAVLPIVALILFGNLLHAIGFLNDNFVKVGNKLVFKIGLTCTLFVNVYNISNFSSISWNFIWFVYGVTLLLFILGYVTAIVTTPIPERRGVILQCTFRCNFAIIGLSLATAVGGASAEALASLVSAFILPVFNILGVVALSLFVHEDGSKKFAWKPVLLGIIKNPMVLGAFAGLVCILLRELQKKLLGDTVFTIKGELPFLFTAINNIKVMTTPLALIITGAQFRFSAVKGMFKEITVGTLWRIVFAPIIGIGSALILSKFGFLSCGTGEIATLIALFGAPAAVSSVVMAGQMGSDEQLATQHLVWSSIGSVITIFAAVCILMATGVLNI
jgi:predicted permease